MSIHTFSSREFTRDISTAKRAAIKGPVFITDRGRPAFALLNIRDYYRITGQGKKHLLEVMESIAGGEFEFNPPHLDISFRTTEFG